MERTGLWAALAAICVSVSVGQQPAVAARNVHNNQVSPTDAWDSRPFVVKSEEEVAELNTTPAGGAFKPGSGQVVACRRHNNIPWYETQDLANLHQALSPPIPANTSSLVICVGVFAVPAGPPGPPPPWRSDLYESGVHVIVVNQCNTADDTTPDSIGFTMNEKFGFSGIALEGKYLQDANGRVVRLTCGLNGNIQQIDQLPGYLGGLDPPVADHSVSTYDTLGHGCHYDFTLEGTTETARVMEGARQPQNQVDAVGNDTDLAIIQLGNPPDWHPLPLPQYVDIIRPFLRDDAIVNLLHCFTGEPYRFFADATGKNIVERPSLAAQIKSTTPPLPSAVISAGIGGNGSFGGDCVDSNGNGRWDPGEKVIGRMPRPDGGTWEVVETP